MIVTIRSSVPVADLDPFRSMPRNPPAPTPGEPRRFTSAPITPSRRPSSRGAARSTGRIGCRGRSANSNGCDGGVRCIPRSRPIRPARPAASAAGWPCSPGWCSTRRPARSWPCRSRRSSTPARGRSSSSKPCPACSTASRSVLGPRCGDFYPVVRGLEPGQKVAIAGAFLLDAETRLNPSLAAGYFGAGGSRRGVAAADSRPTLAGDGLPRSSAARRR